MLKESYYDFHGLLKVKIIGIDSYYQYRYYQCEPFMGRPDILVKIAKPEAPPKGAIGFDHAYYVKEDNIYVRGFTKWDGRARDIFGKFILDIKHLETPHLELTLSRNKSTLLYNILHSLIEVQLLKKGILMLHSSAMEKDGDVVLNIAIGGSFKTTISM
ncbi:unnamed protein product, partial [marine sediment metagenome]